jgi:hypothetical protein
MLFAVVFLNVSHPAWGEGVTSRSFIAPGAESYVFDLAWGESGSLHDEFQYPEGVAVDAKGFV